MTEDERKEDRARNAAGGNLNPVDLRCIRLNHTILFILLYCTTLYFTIPHLPSLQHTVVNCTILCCAIPQFAVLFYDMPHRAIPYCAASCYTILHYAVLNCTLLYCTMLCYIIMRLFFVSLHRLNFRFRVTLHSFISDSFRCS